MDLNEINLADNTLFTSGDAHLAWQTLRAERPVVWQGRPGGVWAVPAKLMPAVCWPSMSRSPPRGGAAIAMLDVSDPVAGLMIHATDPPRHRQYRQQLSPRFSARSVATYSKKVRSVERELLTCVESFELLRPCRTHFYLLEIFRR
jgi:cytochrome P450